MSLVLLLLLLLLCSGSAVARAAEQTVRVATFNVCNYLAMDRRVENRFRPDYPKPESEKVAVRAAIRSVQPAILALQEIGAASYLEELRRDLAAEGLEFPHCLWLDAADPERHVAVLSRVPFTRVALHREIPIRYFGQPELVKRGLLEAAFASPAGEWTLFVAHLKSRHTDRADDPESAERRLREARAIRDLVLNRFPRPREARFLIVGDLNDTTRSKPLAALRRRGRVVISELIPAADSRGETWTQQYRAEDLFSRSDYLLASPTLLLTAVPGGRGFIHDDPETANGSDHRLVYVDLSFASPAPP